MDRQEILQTLDRLDRWHILAEAATHSADPDVVPELWLLTRDIAKVVDAGRLADPEPLMDAADKLKAWLRPINVVNGEPARVDETAAVLAYEKASRCWNRIVAMLSHLVSSVKPSDTDDKPKPDGPVPPDGWRWNGKVFTGCRPTPWRLLKWAWEGENHSAGFDGMAEAVWLDRDSQFAGEPIKQAAAAARRWLKNNGIPMTITHRTRDRIVVIEKSLEK